LVDFDLWSKKTRKKEEIEEAKSYEERQRGIMDNAERSISLIENIAPQESDATDIIDYALSGKSCTCYQSIRCSANAYEQLHHYYGRKVPMVT